MKGFAKWTGIVLGGLIGVAVLAGVMLYPIGMEKLTRSYAGVQVEAVTIPTGADAVARGRDLVAARKCVKCHGEDLSGMLLADDPFLGTLPASNLTSGKGGIGGSYADVDWIRAIRHAIKPDGHAALFMNDEFATMSDEDLGALIAYLKQLPPVDAEYPAMHVGPLTAIAPALGLYTPVAEPFDQSAAR